MIKHPITLGIALLALATIALANTPGKHTIALTWNPSTGATSYNVYRSTTANACSGTPTPIATGITTPQWTDTTVALGQTYYYDVSAVGTGGESACSNEVQVSVPNPPTAPSGLQATVGG